MVSDGLTAVRAPSPAFTICEIWNVDRLPPDVLKDNATSGEVAIAPPYGGFVFLQTIFPPDTEWDHSEFRASLGAAGNEGAARGVGEDFYGMHETDSVDIVTVLEGELYLVLESEEVLLRPGDSAVQRGTCHDWSNRTDRPTTIVAVMMGASRQAVGG